MPNRILILSRGPLSVERDHAAVFQGEIRDRFTVTVGSSASVRFRIPSGKVVVFPCKRIGAESFFFLIEEGLVFHRALGLITVFIKGYGVAVLLPDREHRIIRRDLIRGDPRYRSTSCGVVGAAVEPKEEIVCAQVCRKCRGVSVRGFFHERPAEEGITGP